MHHGPLRAAWRWGFWLACFFPCGAPLAHAAGLTVAAAASVAPAARELASAFEAESGIAVVVSSGATGVLARQIREGAPFDLILAADMATVERLAAGGDVTSTSVAPYAMGRLALYWADDTLPPLTSVKDLASSAAADWRIAIASPAAAPYGAAAMQALDRAGVRAATADRIVYGENVAQAMQYAATGNAQAAFVPEALAKGRPGGWFVVPPGLHDPLRHGLAVCARAPSFRDAGGFRRFVLGPRGQAILLSQGYRPPSSEGP